MENETEVRGSIVKGFIFSIVGAVIGVAIWLVVIWFVRGGTGGAIGGAFSAVTGMLIGGGYRLGAKRAGFLGVIVGLILAVVSAFIVVYQGAAIILYREGLADSISEGSHLVNDLMATNSTFNSAIMTDLVICVVITLVMTMLSLRSSKNNKKETETTE